MNVNDSLQQKQKVSQSLKQTPIKTRKTYIIIPPHNILPRSLIPLLTPNHQPRLQRHNPRKQ